MSTLAVTNPTLLDLTSRLGADGQVSNYIAEMLSQTNEILDDMTFLEANGGTVHEGTVRTGLPTAYFKKYYGFTPPSKSRTVKVRENMGMIRAYSEVDKDLAKHSGDIEKFRMTEETAFIEAMNQKLATSLFYANEATSPEEFTGFAPRFNDQSAENGENILTSAATPDGTDNSSIWLVVWSPLTVHGLYPKGSQAGLRMEDKGEQIKYDANGGVNPVLMSEFCWDVGLHVKDWRYVVRINYDAEDLLASASSGPDLVDLMAEALDYVPSLNIGRPVFYGNRKAQSFLRRQLMNKTKNSTLSIEDLTRANGARKRFLTVDGVPFKRCDAITNTEAGL